MKSGNSLIPKPYAIEYAFQYFKEERNPYTNLYISCDAIKVKQAQDYMRQNIFGNLDLELSGWLFLFDMMSFANWEHPCKYLFVIDENNVQEIAYRRGPVKTVLMEQLY